MLLGTVLPAWLPRLLISVQSKTKSFSALLFRRSQWRWLRHVVRGHALRDPGPALQKRLGAPRSGTKAAPRSAQPIADKLRDQPFTLRLQKWSGALQLTPACSLPGPPPQNGLQGRWWQPRSGFDAVRHRHKRLLHDAVPRFSPCLRSVQRTA